MIGSIGKIILNFVIGLVNIILLPIDLLIDSFLPDISNLLSYVSSMFSNLLGPILLYTLDLFLLPRFVVIAIFEYLIFKITFPLAVYFVKIALKWYNSLKV